MTNKEALTFLRDIRDIKRTNGSASHNVSMVDALSFGVSEENILELHKQGYVTKIGGGDNIELVVR